MQVLDHLTVLLPALFDALSAPSERVAVEALAVLGALAADDEGQFRSLMRELLDRCALAGAFTSTFHSPSSEKTERSLLCIRAEFV